jgi:hypothetical protein
MWDIMGYIATHDIGAIFSLARKSQLYGCLVEDCPKNLADLKNTEQ